MRIIFATESPWKREVLAKTGLVFESVASEYDEDMTLDMTPEELAKHLALGKAREIAKRSPDSVIISTDVFVTFDKKVLGKAKNADDARNRLKSYIGKPLVVVCGLAIVSPKREITDVAISKILIRKDLTDEDIELYIKTGEPLRGAGSIQASLKGMNIIDDEGDHNTNIGVPVFKILKHLRSLGVNPLCQQ